MIFVPELELQSIPEKEGLAAFDLSLWNSSSKDFGDNFIDDFSIDFLFFAGSDFVRVEFGNTENESYRIKNNQLLIGFSESGFMASVTVLGIGVEDIKIIKEYSSE